MSDTLLALLENSQRDAFIFWVLENGYLTAREVGVPELVDYAWQYHRTEFERYLKMSAAMPTMSVGEIKFRLDEIMSTFRDEALAAREQMMLAEIRNEKRLNALMAEIGGASCR